MKTDNKPDPKAVRNFGLMFTVILTVLSGLLYYRGRSTYPLFLGLAVLFGAPALIYPAVLTPIFVQWMRFARGLAWVNTRVILVLMFYLIVTPLGLVLRLFGFDPLKEKIKPDLESYWEEKSLAKDPERYKRQF